MNSNAGSNWSRFQFVKSGTKICIVAITCLLTIEVSTRFDDVLKYSAPFWGTYSDKRLRTVDDAGIRRNVPNSRFEKWHNNRFGFRGQEVSVGKPPGVTRIVCMGTSETYGLYESPGKEWPNQLMDMLRPTGKYQVINSSVVGLPLHLYRPYLEKYVLRFKPDIVILLVNPYPFILRAERSSRSIRGTTRPHNEGDDGAKRTFCSRGLAKMKLRLIDELKRQLPPELLMRYRVWKYSKEVQEAEKLYLKGKSPKDFVPQSDIVLFRKELKKLVDFLEQNGTDVVLSSYPVLIEPENLKQYHDIYLENRVGCVELSMTGIIDAARRINREIELLAFEMDVGFVDSNRSVPKSTQYFADNLHYTDAGAGMVAINFARYLSRATVTGRPMKRVAAGNRTDLN